VIDGPGKSKFCFYLISEDGFVLVKGFASKIRSFKRCFEKLDRGSAGGIEIRSLFDQAFSEQVRCQ
jgi:hypothetical protein